MNSQSWSGAVLALTLFAGCMIDDEIARPRGGTGNANANTAASTGGTSSSNGNGAGATAGSSNAGSGGNAMTSGSTGQGAATSSTGGTSGSTGGSGTSSGDCNGATGGPPCPCDPALAPFGGGTGTPDDPFLVCSPAQLNSVAAFSAAINPVANFKLAADIDMNGVSLTSVTELRGKLDGDGHKLQKITIHQPQLGNVGAFQAVYGSIVNLTFENTVLEGKDSVAPVGALKSTNGAFLSNVHSIGPSITGTGPYVSGLLGNMEAGTKLLGCSATQVSITHLSGDMTGGLVGDARGNGTLIDNAFTSGTVTVGSGNYHGGLAGYLAVGATIQGSSSTASVQGGLGHSLGGLVGAQDTDTTVQRSFSTGSVKGHYRIGGLVGILSIHSSIQDSYSRSTVTVIENGDGDALGGGLVGEIYNNSAGSLTTSWSAGKVSSSVLPAVLGGLVGKNSDYPVSDCYWDAMASGQSQSAGGTGKTTSQMQDPATFVGWSSPPWVFVQGAYPSL